MRELFSRVSNQLTEMWGSFDKSQKNKMILVTIAIILALVGTIFMLTRPNFVVFNSDELSLKQVSEITQILKNENIKYSTANDDKTILVDSKRLTDAKLAISVSEITDESFKFEDAIKSEMSETESVKREKFRKVKENDLANSLSKINGIEDATVNLIIPEYSRLAFSKQRESSASIILHTSTDLTQNQIMSVVDFVRASVENLKTENVTVTDQNLKQLYSGDLDSEYIGSSSKRFDIEMQMKKNIIDDVKTILNNQFDNVAVSVKLEMDFDEKSSKTERVENPLGDVNKGYIKREVSGSSSGKNTQAGGVPGTDSNDMTQYPIDSGTNSESKAENNNVEYLYSHTTLEESKSVGNILYEKSSMSVVVTNNRSIDYNVVKDSGELKDISWDKYKENILSENIDIVIDSNIISLLKKATGIADVEVIGRTNIRFVEDQNTRRTLYSYLPIMLVGFVLILLVYVIYKGTEPVEITEIEPELSVEDMLSKNSDGSDIEEIQDSDGSGIKKEIERFVEDSPEAAAQLLRNWLNEDWE